MKWLGLAFVLLAAAGAAAAAPLRELVVCADPNNLPFSNRTEEGFENKIVQLVAEKMHAKVRYVWWAQRRGYVRNTLNEAKCDVWPGVASGVSMVATTHPYYTSTYVFVTRARDPLESLTLDDARLRIVSIGVQMIGNDANNTPPAHAIASRGIIDNVRGFMLYGNYDRENPASPIVDAVARSELDVALVWGPLAGYFVARASVPLRIQPVTPSDDPRWPMSYDISMGVQRANAGLREQIDSILLSSHETIDRILQDYQVPTLPPHATTAVEIK